MEGTRAEDVKTGVKHDHFCLAVEQYRREVRDPWVKKVGLSKHSLGLKENLFYLLP